jgi:hypothetical protein
MIGATAPRDLPRGLNAPVDTSIAAAAEGDPEAPPGGDLGADAVMLVVFAGGLGAAAAGDAGVGGMLLLVLGSRALAGDEK